MSTQLQAFTDDQIDVIYKATHLTETLNKKLATALPAGIYQGFNLVANGTTDLVGIDPDAGATGHVAVIENDAGRSITVRNSGVGFTVDLSTLRDAVTTKKFAIAIWGQYSKGSNTGAAIRAYETYPTNELLTAPEASTLAILGEVELAADAGPLLIPAAAITQARRSSAWQNLAPGHGLWRPLLQNGNFEAASTVGNEQWGAYGWRLGDANSLLSASGVDAYIGGKSLNWTAVGLSSLIFTAEQYLGEPVTEGTDRIRVRGFYKILQVPVSGEIEVVLDFAGATGTPGTLDVRYLIPVDHISADWEEFGAIVDVPAGATRLHSFSLECDDTIMEVGAATHIARFDDWQVWKSWNGPESQQAGRLGERVDASLRDLMFPLDTYTDRQTAPRMNRSVNTLLGTPTIDVAQGGFRARNSLGVGDDLVQSLAEATTARLVLPHRATNDTVDGDVLTLLLESLPHTGTESAVRIYSDDLGNLSFTTNAKYTALNTWTRDSDTDIATMVRIGGKDGISQLFAAADGAATVSFDSYFNFFASRLLSETAPGSDFASLWEMEDPNLDGAAPYTGNSSPDGATGWWDFAGGGGEAYFFRIAEHTTFAFIEDGTYLGWWRIVGLNGDAAKIQLAPMTTGTAFNFSVSETATFRFYQGVQIGKPARSVGNHTGIHMMVDWTVPTEAHISIQEANAYDPFTVTGQGHVTATRYAYTEYPYLDLNVPLTLFHPTVHTDWDLTGALSGTEMYYEADGPTDYLVGELPLQMGDVLRRVHVNIQAATAANQYTTVVDYLGTSLASTSSGGSTARQTESFTVNHPITITGALPRIYCTSGAAGDRVYYVTIEIQRLGV